MSSDIFDDLFGTQSITPGLGAFQTKGTSKLLVVIFVVDCSKTMSGDRIGAVNAALQELKYQLTEIKNDNSLDLKVAIMSFASNAKWELQLTPIDEVDLRPIHTRPGLTEYGAAFHELNKVLCKEKFMKHTGKIAPPAIMFLTDGEPEDDYQFDLDELLKNAWFTNASRSAVLLGDAIYNVSARDAVRQFVKDEDNDIVTAEDSTVIIQKIRVATMHTVAGDPIQDDVESSLGATGLFGDASTAGLFDSQNIFDDLTVGVGDSNAADSFGGNTLDGWDPFEDDNLAGNDPFGGSLADDNDPFGDIMTDGDKAIDDCDPLFGDVDNLFDDGDNPFGDGGDPFGGLI